MNGTKQNKWVAVLCMAALAGCASDRMSDSSSSANTGYTAPGTTAASSTAGTGSPSSAGTGETGSSTAGTGTGSMGSTGSLGSTGNSGSTGSMGGTSSAQASYGTVLAIDQMQRQDVGVGAVGAAAAGGTMGGSPTDRVYRVTLRMDDGSSQLVVVDAMPGYKIGDRVRYNNGTLTPY